MGKVSKIEIKLKILPIEEDGYHIFMPLRINGKKANFLVDTGASRSVVDRDRIHNFFGKGEVSMEKIEKLSTGLGTNTMESNTVVLHTFSFGRKVFKEYQAVALDLSHVNQSYDMLGLKPIDGVLGGDLLARLKAQINYEGKKLVIKY